MVAASAVSLDGSRHQYTPAGVAIDASPHVSTDFAVSQLTVFSVACAFYFLPSSRLLLGYAGRSRTFTLSSSKILHFPYRAPRRACAAARRFGNMPRRRCLLIAVANIYRHFPARFHFRASLMRRHFRIIWRGKEAQRVPVTLHRHRRLRPRRRPQGHAAEAAPAASIRVVATMPATASAIG